MSGFDFSDKVMLVTGGAGGIGSALCRRFAEGGARCVVVDIDEIRAGKLAAELPGAGHRGVGCDLMDRVQVERLFELVADSYGRLDVLVNNVGMTSAERFDLRSVESIEQEITLNLTSPLVATRIAIPLLKASRDARVVTTVSLGGIFPLGETPIYTASKFGLRGAMLAIGLDLRSKGILAGSVLPSATDTRMLRQEAVDGGNSMQFQDRPQQPADVVAAVVSLLDKPRLEAYPRPGESRLVRLAMLVPNLLPRILPLFRRRGDRGMARYLEELRQRGLARRTDGRWELVEKA
ncbi:MULTISPECIES: SDR family NAD(P)-dependent oxidoreductase [unclassified Streptomyces]|uniref:SDR family NAD(P)-dependent oxidoreductase n=1 Tax=unclassified Streptomyces TaxID=2593676 RepID=UPI001164E5B0|nr:MULTISPECIES: SDR family oxidoreductase [unclassified Streptomyces]QDN62686.1 SDR family oxidoreductase [Streptomyces sp. S1D4-20]QDN72736.1 SDR family oxidoreductase [Streptomyces sp. S1D4-14]QDO55263.1 SDR family oxidoreductase [Streptomyces sp. RLB3-5]QDO65439.1 SDR family oxidoreductase [Streptomyces sp. RLB1-8]